MEVHEARERLAYDAWATDTLFGALASLPEERLLNAETPGGQSILGICIHMVVAAERWFTGLSGGDWRSVQAPPVSGLADLSAYERRTRMLLESVLAGLTAGRLGEVFVETWTVADVVQQVANHGTYHRGQIALLLAQAGIECPDTDWVLWRRQGGDSPRGGA